MCMSHKGLRTEVGGAALVPGWMTAGDECSIAFVRLYSRRRKVRPATMTRMRGWPLQRRVRGNARSMRQVGELGRNNCP